VSDRQGSVFHQPLHRMHTEVVQADGNWLGKMLKLLSHGTVWRTALKTDDFGMVSALFRTTLHTAPCERNFHILPSPFSSTCTTSPFTHCCFLLAAKPQFPASY